MSDMDDEIAVKYNLQPGEVLLNGKPARSLEVARRIREARDSALEKELAFNRLCEWLESPAAKEAFAEDGRVAYATTMALVKRLGR